ncbi:MAG: prepilin-type N-terminal cleavage/methylation domain-containing protein [Verrucomicrobia subdivision 3 bacterium]|nr:prepilin-type N-terminal cleavage/methylation domain-containing protein [Limisphaerales bacterium]
MSRTPSNPRLNAAFTLVEIMVVLAIMGLLLGLAMINFRAINQREPLEQAVSDVEGLCRRARSEAIVKSRPIDLTIDSGSGLLRLATAPNAVNTLDPDSGVLVATIEEAVAIDQASLPSNVELEIQVPEDALDSETPGVVVIRFYPNGTAEPLKALIMMPDEGVYTLVLDPVTGRLQIREGEDEL